MSCQIMIGKDSRLYKLYANTGPRQMDAFAQQKTIMNEHTAYIVIISHVWMFGGH